TGQTFSSFGFYLTGLGDQAKYGTLSLQFHDTKDELIPIPGAPTGGLLYFWFIGTTVPITDFQLVMTGVVGPNRDVFWIDDSLLSTSTGPVPAPSALWLTGIGLSIWLGGRALRRKGRSRLG